MYTEHKPEAELQRSVECTWSIATALPVRAYSVRPDGCMDLIYSPDRGVEVVGVMTCEQRFDLPAGEHLTGLRFHPGRARAFLRVHSSELRDRIVPLDTVIGPRARALRDALDGARSDPARRRLLLGAVASNTLVPDPVHLAIDAMTSMHGDLDVDWVARQAGLSTRQFRRRCREECGLGPKQLARILRFRRACVLASRGAGWPAVAAEAGYFDQAHLIRDFREFTGCTPASVFSKTATPAIG